MASTSITFIATATAASVTLSDVVATIFPTPPVWVPMPKSYPNITLCHLDNFFLGKDAKDPYAPPGPYPVKGQQVYIGDAQNFCLNLPNPNSTYLKAQYYDQGFAPSIVQAEGFVQCFCVGSYLSPGCHPMPVGGITAAHVLTGQSLGGSKYVQITGRMDCGVLNINCVGSYFGVYDDGGQYDSVPYVNCGKEPYSGVDSSMHPSMPEYVLQAGDGIFCMRICAGGRGTGDPCNAKNDTAGCYLTMGFVDTPGFSTDGVSVNVNLPPPSSNTLGNYLGPYEVVTAASTTTVAFVTTTLAVAGDEAVTAGVTAPAVGAAGVSAAAGSTSKSGGVKR
ncbi:hypothetical protein HK101_003038, partial [Irineochytrium annulatum]